MAVQLSDVTVRKHHAELGRDMIRWLSCLVFHAGSPLDTYNGRWPRSINRSAVEHAAAAWPNLQTKAATPPGSTLAGNWGESLKRVELFDGFLASIREESVLSDLPVTPCLFYQNVPKRMTGASAAWIGENRVKKGAALAFSNVVLPPTKDVTFVAVNGELLKLMKPQAVDMIYRSLVSDVVASTDKQFLSANPAVAGEVSKGILNGIVATAGGTTPDEKLTALLSAFFTALPTASEPRLIMSPASASAFSVFRSTPGPGIPDLVTNPHAGNHVIITDASMIAVADEGVVSDVSKEADIQLDDAPIDPPTAAAVYTSLWQTNRIAFRTERAIRWDSSGAGTQFFDLAAGA